MNSKWILFESGALSKTEDAYVCTFLVDVSFTDVEQPLGQFQHTTREKEDVRKLVQDINEKVGKTGGHKLKEELLNKVFEDYWPSFSEQLNVIAANRPSDGPPNRSEIDIVKEILEIVRGIDRRVSEQEISLKKGERGLRFLEDWDNRVRFGSSLEEIISNSNIVKEKSTSYRVALEKALGKTSYITSEQAENALRWLKNKTNSNLTEEQIGEIARLYLDKTTSKNGIE